MKEENPKIVIFTIENTFFYPEMWAKVLARNPDAIKAAFFFQRLPSKFSSLKYKYLETGFFGFKNVLKIALKALFLQARHFLKNGAFISVKKEFLKKNIPVYSYKSIKDVNFKNKLKEIAPDLVISVGTHQIVPADILEIPGEGVLNKHGSLLPKYAGYWPLFWALYSGEKITGVTIHKMLSVPDAGQIIHQKSFVIEDIDTLYSLQHKSLMLAADMVCDIVVYYFKNRHLPFFCQVNLEKPPSLSRFPGKKDRIYLERIMKRSLA